MKFNYVICHYVEIGVKGKNRRFFEDRLTTNIKEALKRDTKESIKSVLRVDGRILVELSDKADFSKIENSLKTVCGIGYFSFAKKVKSDFEVFKKEVIELLKDEKFETFRMSARRADKNFSMKSMEINAQLGEEVINKLDKKVKLKKADIDCIIEMTFREAFIYFKKIKGIGGLPVGTSGKVVSLLSGGIDSPVSSFYACKRGAKNVFVHFHTYPYTPKLSIDKVKQLARIVNKFQFTSKLYLVPFGDLQKEVFLKAPDKLRIILYRRFMMRIAEKIAKREKINAMLTGESLGQVASQTLENIRATEAVTTLPILRPLIGLDKEEIIEKANEIGTYETSILPHDDCCSRFMPKHPETRAKLDEVEKVEEVFEIERMVNEAIEKTEIETIK